MSNLIKDTCKALGITQKELAEKMGVHEVTVNNWARGSKDVPEWAVKFIVLLSESNISDKISKNIEELSRLAKEYKK